MKLKTLLGICFLAVSLSACDDDKFPKVDFKLVDWSRQRYLNHRVTDAENLAFEGTTYSSDLENLHGHYCAPKRQVAAALDWAREMKQHCVCR